MNRSGRSRAPLDGAIGAAFVFVAAAAGVAATQPRLAAIAHDVKERDDVFVLPPPGELKTAVLGWDAAAVDLLWADLLVAYGTHWADKREFHDIPKYVDAILGLEPDYAPVYRFVDTLLAYRPLLGTEADARLARGYLERGTHERPDDAQVWMKYGQFLSYVGPSFLTSEEERAAWRKEGAAALGRAVEFGGSPELALTAATGLTRAGQTREAIRYLEHAYAFTEHPSMHDVHEAIGRKLAALEANAALEAADAASRVIDERWQRELPAVPRDRYLLLGPAVDPAKCAGVSAPDDPACARDWSAVTSRPSSGGSP